MRTIYEVIVGALVFISIDRIARVISSHMVDKEQNRDEVKKSMLKIELMTLMLVLFIAIHFIKF
jgi:hypothetical protein